MVDMLAGHIDEFDGERRKLLDVNGREVVVFRHEDRFYALDNTCIHMGGPVGEGVIKGRVCAVIDEAKRLVREEYSEDSLQIVCPWHGWAYDIDTGEFAGNSKLSLATYDVEVRDGGVYVLG